ncbi:hypothetical protein HW532_12790 [Kaustia mangrovi]|uniref:Uncharacterized protein n=1 Tax=Kaustia mangrovi TaxID=2593653 RepID=A0A7S8C4Z5_9HYPH|nr:hypothetical protein [Kaustia mangrovi]QPC43494.1 hypothetical protein HW532_12790 [Kaustia mangrovi]
MTETQTKTEASDAKQTKGKVARRVRASRLDHKALGLDPKPYGAAAKR